MSASIFTRGLDLPAAARFWSSVTDIPTDQFRRPYRAVADATTRHNKHQHGCAHVMYGCTPTHRAIMGMLAALTVAPWEERDATAPSG